MRECIYQGMEETKIETGLIEGKSIYLKRLEDLVLYWVHAQSYNLILYIQNVSFFKQESVKITSSFTNAGHTVHEKSSKRIFEKIKFFRECKR